MPIRVERDRHWVTVVLTNPAKRNAIDIATWKTLAQVFSGFANDQLIRCVVLKGEYGHFAAGADISEFPRLRSNIEQARHYHEELIAHTLQAIQACPCPVIASIEGQCMGGGLELALACDLRIAADSATFGIPIARLGFPLALTELVPLVSLVGPAVATELLMDTTPMNAADAASKGLITRVIPAPQLHEHVNTLALRICMSSPTVMRANKRNVARVRALTAQLTRSELDASYSFINTSDYREGVAAFLDKRIPNFTGS